MLVNIEATGWRLVSLLALDALIFVVVCTAFKYAVFGPPAPKPTPTPTTTTIVCVDGSSEESAQVREAQGQDEGSGSACLAPFRVP